MHILRVCTYSTSRWFFEESDAVHIHVQGNRLGKEQYVLYLKPRPRIVLETQGSPSHPTHYYHVNRLLTRIPYDGICHESYEKGRELHGRPRPEVSTMALANRLRSIPGVQQVNIWPNYVSVVRLIAFDWDRVDYEVIKAIMVHLGWRHTAPLGRAVQYANALKMLVHELRDRSKQYLYSVDIVHLDKQLTQQPKSRRRRRSHTSTSHGTQTSSRR